MSDEFLVLFYLICGILHAMTMARWFEQGCDNDIALNCLAWPFLIVFRLLKMAWRISAGYSPSYYKKWYYIWSR